MTVCAPLPYRLLLRQFLDGGPTGPSRRAMAIVAARGDWLTADFLNNADEPTLRGRLLDFYEAIVDPPLHCDTLARKTLFVHGNVESHVVSRSRFRVRRGQRRIRKCARGELKASRRRRVGRRE